MQKATLRVLGIQKLDVQADNTTVLDVLIELYDGEDAIEQRRLSFPLDTSSEALQEELNKFLETFNLDREQGEANKALDEANASADEVISELKGFTIGEPPVNYDAEKKDTTVADEGEAAGVDTEAVDPGVTDEKPADEAVEPSADTEDKPADQATE